MGPPPPLLRGPPRQHQPHDAGLPAARSPGHSTPEHSRDSKDSGQRQHLVPQLIRSMYSVSRITPQVQHQDSLNGNHLLQHHPAAPTPSTTTHTAVRSQTHSSLSRYGAGSAHTPHAGPAISQCPPEPAPHKPRLLDEAHVSVQMTAARTPGLSWAGPLPSAWVTACRRQEGRAHEFPASPELSVRTQVEAPPRADGAPGPRRRTETSPAPDSWPDPPQTDQETLYSPLPQRCPGEGGTRQGQGALR